MTEIDAQVDLSHPADRVWRALTEPALLARWFADAEVPASGGVLLRTAGLPGFEATVEVEVIDRRPPELLVLGCLEDGRRTRLTCTLTSTVEGCRVAVRESLEQGDWPADQAASREEYYQQALSGRLQALLDWLAFQQVDLRRGRPAPTAELPLVPVVRPASAARRRAAIAGVLTAAVLATGGVVWAFAPGEPEPSAAPPPAAPPTATVDETPALSATGSARPTRGAVRASASPSRTPTTRTPPTPTAVTSPAAVLAVRYRTVSTRLLGYTGEVVLENSGRASAKGWSVVVTLAEGGTVANADGADWRQDGRTVTFTGGPVAAGKSRTFTFDVRDASLAKAPEGCTVGSTPCAGL